RQCPLRSEPPMPVHITKTFLPPLEDYQAMISRIFDDVWLTNHGPLVGRLEKELAALFGVRHCLAVTNGTTGLQIALRALKIGGEVITTPFSYVATTSSIVWEGATPVMADIDPETLNISPLAIERAVTSRSSAILATHIYGNACDIEGIAKVAAAHGLAVIYDAAHAFGSRYRGKSIFTYGDVAATSLHATKLFHTVEGGALFTERQDLAETMARMRNFGHIGQEAFAEAGINGKMSELHAAMGLCLLPYIETIMSRRREASGIYDKYLEGLPLQRQRINPGCDYNHSYYPVIFESEKQLLTAISALNAAEIYPRRYFYPSLSNLSYVCGQKTPLAESISVRVLCLPLYHDISADIIEQICGLIKKAIA
ncbi:DegT/DnrJ/EryC1/StrS family aminotransferase, partial [Desulfovibrio sp. OttesenSCG-928-G11]|nr:DegT/DnrJ/EryC1/StrS family aminotransferase [Desulfovibrio sp. OttesenSCG-928-G11]